MNTKKLVIANVDTKYSAEYIANVLWYNEIAKVSTITLLPHIYHTISHTAFIEIESYCDTLCASSFVERVKRGPYHFTHNDLYPENNVWLFELNPLSIGSLYVGAYTKTFMPDFFTYPEEEDTYVDEAELCSTTPNVVEEECIQEDQEPEPMPEPEPVIVPAPVDRMKCPIEGLYNDYYSVDEALERIWQLNEEHAQETALHSFNVRIVKIEEEIMHLHKKLNEWDAQYSVSKMLHINPPLGLAEDKLHSFELPHYGIITV